MSIDLPPERLYLTGFMGSGKSTVGQTLANRLDWSFRDLDDLIESGETTTITEIFENHGEEYFRDLETSYLRREAERDPPFVLATGGGIPCRETNRALMRSTGTTIYLNVDFDVLYGRITGDDERPLVKETDDTYRELNELWRSRQEHYREADVEIELADEEPSVVVRMILERLK